MRMPTLETERLLIRPFALGDLAAVHQLLDEDLAEADFGSDGAMPLDERRQWLEWAVLNYEQLAKLHQPPYGDRAVTLKTGGEVMGAVGFVPAFNVFERLPGLRPSGAAAPAELYTPEFGLYYAVAPRHQRRGYAAEAARAMIRYAFGELKVKRIVATTTYDNEGSMGVMRRLGMRIEKNPYPDPEWLQVVGILDNA
jgi:RimJ/RimL family protein N-acetyltransferase